MSSVFLFNGQTQYKDVYLILMQEYTLCFPITDNNSIVLGYKKRGHGANLYNGFGGKIEQNETKEQCALRELEEECGILSTRDQLIPIAELLFKFYEYPKQNCFIYAYLLNHWDRHPNETDEMLPQIFRVADIPYNNMHETDMIWMPFILQGRKIHATFTYKKGREILSACNMSFES